MANSMMRAAVYVGPGKLSVELRPIPQPGPGEVLLRVRACGICGSDLHLLHADSSPAAPGMILGHEVAATVVALGEGVSGYAAGEAVVVEPLLTCGVCRCCREGRDSICPQLRILGAHTDGAFADYLSVPVRRLYRIPGELDYRTASLAEPVAVAVHGLRVAGFKPGQRLLVLGAGAIGLAVTAVARAWGAGEILLTARHPHQAELGRTLGATRILDDKQSTLDRMEELGHREPLDLIAETVGGNSNTLNLAGAALAPGGTILVLGLNLAPVPVDAMRLLHKEARLQWSNCYYSRQAGKSDFDESLRLLSEQRSTFSQLLTHSTPLDAIDRAFALARDKKSGSVKVTVMMEP
jgi:threonine dehydrogenase-like Zn-dependent dehydrogenase